MFKIVQMTDTYAGIISKWRYPAPYDIYNFTEADASEHYKVMLSNTDEVVGFYCIGEAARVPLNSESTPYNCSGYVDVGLGLRPDLCGRGLGKELLETALHDIRIGLGFYSYRLTVATFNERAIKLYKQFEFKTIDKFSNASDIAFEVMVASHFDRIVDRSRQSAIKHFELEKRFNGSIKHSLWVADMDFEVAESISIALNDRALDKIYGYTARPDDYWDAAVNWFNRKHGMNIAPHHLIHSPGAVTSINVSVESLTKPKDKVIIQPPVYHPFYAAIENSGRIVVENPLIFTDGDYAMNYDELEQQAKDATLLILCNPHNPVGRVWRPDELRRLEEICSKNNVQIVSDEIHCDLVFKPFVHTSMQTIAERSIPTFVSATKAFNIAGLQASFIIAKDSQQREALSSFFSRYDIELNNSFSLKGVEAAFNGGEKWLNAVLDYIRENMLYIKSFCEEHLPEIKPNLPEGTYLQWLDCRALGLSSEELDRLLVEKAHMAVNNGSIFGLHGEGYIRLNVACPRSILESAMADLKRAVNFN